MPTITNYLQIVSGGVMAPDFSVWVQLTNNATQVQYVSTAATDPTGLFSVINVPAGSYTVATGPSSVGPWIGTGNTSFTVADRTPWFDVMDYGATGNGVTDDTTAINAAFAAAGANLVKFPQGTYVYNGTGLDGTRYNISGAGRGSTTILLGNSSYFLKSAQDVVLVKLEDMQITGGLGAIYFTNTGAQTNGTYTVRNVKFLSYTQTAIGHTRSDNPFWHFENCWFQAANSTSTLGVTLSGLGGGVDFVSCFFAENKVHVKLGNGGNDHTFVGCTFLQLNAGTQRACIWVVPDVVGTNAGAGFYVAPGNKFGNENQDPSDFRILYADEISGGDFTTNLPQLAADSTGFIKNHVVDGCHFAGAGATNTAPPIVYSTTPNIYGSRYSGLFHGTQPIYIIQYRTVPLSAAGARNTQRNYFGPWLRDAPGDLLGVTLSNANTPGYVIDPDSILQDNTGAVYTPGGGDIGEFARLTPDAVNSFTLTGGSSKVSATDLLGAQDAVELTATAVSDAIIDNFTTANVVAGKPVWVEFDLKQGSSLPMATITVKVEFTSGGGNQFWQRTLNVPAAWRHYRYLAFVDNVGTASRINFTATGWVTGTATKVDIGRVIVYHAREPLVRSLNILGPTPWIDALTRGGANDGAKIGAAIAALPSTGGLVLAGETMGPVTDSTGTFFASAPSKLAAVIDARQYQIGGVNYSGLYLHDGSSIIAQQPGLGTNPLLYIGTTDIDPTTPASNRQNPVSLTRFAVGGTYASGNVLDTLVVGWNAVANTDTGTNSPGANAIEINPVTGWGAGMFLAAHAAIKVGYVNKNASAGTIGRLAALDTGNFNNSAWPENTNTHIARAVGVLAEHPSMPAGNLSLSGHVSVINNNATITWVDGDKFPAFGMNGFPIVIGGVTYQLQTTPAGGTTATISPVYAGATSGSVAFTFQGNQYSVEADGQSWFRTDLATSVDALGGGGMIIDVAGNSGAPNAYNMITLRDKNTVNADKTYGRKYLYVNGTTLGVRNQANASDILTLGDTGLVSIAGGIGLNGAAGISNGINATTGWTLNTSGSSIITIRGGLANSAVLISPPAVSSGSAEAPTFNVVSPTVTLTASFANQRANFFGNQTLTGAFTITNAATVAIQAAPTAAGGATLTNAYALWVMGGVSHFDGNIQLVGSLNMGANNLITDTVTGTKIGTATTQKLGFFNSAPIVQPSAVGTATGYAAGTTAATFHSDDTYTGNVGATAYTLNGVVAALKNLGFLAQ